ncbi:hypothetical protein [Lysinibacillus boronitolerans]|nr:hypothetical protein [Lysinibacillus boronitolerans]
MEQFLQRYIDSWRLNGWFIHDIFFLHRARYRTSTSFVYRHET